MITLFIVESIIMFAAGWLFGVKRYDKYLAEQTKVVRQLNEALSKATTLMGAQSSLINVLGEENKRLKGQPIAS